MLTDTTPARRLQRTLPGFAGGVRVAIVAESFLPQVNGVTNSVLRVVDHLAGEGHEVLVLAPGYPPQVSGARVVALRSLPLPGYADLRLGVPTARTLVRELEGFGPDVVHLASPFVLGGPAIRAAERLRLPVVAVYQTDVAGFAQRYGLGGAAELAWRRVRAIHDHAALTLAPSPSAVRDVAEHGIRRVLLWARGVDATAFSPRHRSAELRARLAPDGEVLVGFVGRLAAEKRVQDLAAVADLPGVRVVVVGDGPERTALEHALPGAVFTGLRRGPELSALTASLDVAVQTGPHETFCQAAQEAMASGVPVVGPAAGGVADLVDPSRTGWLYPPGDLDSLRGHVRDLAGDAAKRLAMGRAARAAVAHRTWHSVGEQLVEHYRAATKVRAVTG
ncbi:MAG TPA: glycosyltransferase family 1 protein [Actinotalea sp.]|nr:glycosyltransferase family 1 protein [Actinotalea sp.]